MSKTCAEAIAVIDGWRQIPGIVELASGIEFCPDHRDQSLAVVEDVDGHDAGGLVLGGLYTCPKCRRAFFQTYAVEVIKATPDEPAPTSQTEMLAKARKMAKERARGCPGCWEPVTFGDEWKGKCPHCGRPLLSLATPPPGWDEEG